MLRLLIGKKNCSLDILDLSYGQIITIITHTHTPSRRFPEFIADI